MDMWYSVLLAVPFALWVFTDAKKRMNHVVGWPLGTLFLPIVLLPIYLTKKPSENSGFYPLCDEKSLGSSMSRPMKKARHTDRLDDP